MSFIGGLFSDKKTVDTKNTQQSSSSTGLSDQVKDYWSSISGLYNPSAWENVDPNAYQINAANRTAGYASGLNPAFAQANQIGGTGISGGDISRFMSPYTQNVVDATRANFAQENSRQDAQNNANAAKLGALSGTQPLVARAVTESMRRPGQDAAIAGLYDKGFQTSLNAANQSTGLQLQGVNSANAIAGQQSGINQTGFGQGTQLWNQAWQNAGGANAQAAQGAQVLASLSPQSGVTSTGSSTGTNTTTATPSPFSIGANLAGMAISAYTGMPMPPGGGGKADGGRVEMAAGGTVGVKPRESDPHHRLTTAFDAVRGMLERARGGSVLPKFDAGGAVGPSYSPGWNTTVTPAPEASSFDVKKFGEGLSAMGKPKDASGRGGDDGSGALRSAQQDLSSFMSQHSIKPGYADGGEVDEYGGADGDLPAPIAGGGSGIPPGPTRATMKGYVPDTAQNFTNAVKRFEGYAPEAWRDYKQNSVGYGTRARYPGEVIDRPEADRRLNSELDNARGQVTAFAPNLDPGTQAALTSMTYNAGAKWMTSGLGAAIRAGDMDTARRLFQQYNKAGGEVLPGLVKRRAEEATWMGGDVPATTGSAVMAGGDGVSTGLAPVSQSAGPPAEKTWMQRNLPGLTEGVFDGKQMTPSQRLGTALMSVRGPMFEGPANGIARSIMEMDGSRQKDDQIKNQKNQFGRTIGLEDRKVGLAEAKSPAEIALLQAQAAAHRAAAANKEDPTQTYKIREAQADRMGMNRDSPEYREFVLTGKMSKQELSPTAQKQVLESTEALSGAVSAQKLLNSAKDLNEKSWSGIGANQRAWIVSQLPAGMVPEGAANTRELGRIMMSQVLSSLKDTFGAAPTEGERKILVEIESAINGTENERNGVIKRALERVKAREALHTQMLNDLRGGTMFKPQGPSRPGTSGATPDPLGIR